MLHNKFIYKSRGYTFFQMEMEESSSTAKMIDEIEEATTSEATLDQ